MTRPTKPSIELEHQDDLDAIAVAFFESESARLDEYFHGAKGRVDRLIEACRLERRGPNEAPRLVTVGAYDAAVE